jgi:hypothetical protein
VTKDDATKDGAGRAKKAGATTARTKDRAVGFLKVGLKNSYNINGSENNSFLKVRK